METFTYNGRQPRVVFEDPDAEHEIRLFIVGNNLAVACSCMGRRNEPHGALEVRKLFPAQEAQAVWKAHARNETLRAPTARRRTAL